MNHDKIENQKSILQDVDSVLDNAYKENEEFNKDFDGTTPLKFKSYQSDAEYMFEKSEVLFKLDRPSYFEEYNIWENRANEDKHKEVTKYLKDNGLINIFRELVSTIQRKKIAPFVGAGISRPLGLPLWDKALKDILARVYVRKNPNIENLIAQYKYLEAAEKLFQKDQRAFISYISDEFLINPGATSNDIIVGALKYITDISHGCVITTNFDKVLEKTFEFSKKPFQGFMMGSQIDNSFIGHLIKGNRCLLKLHGNVGEEKSYVFTETQYNKSYGTVIDFKKDLPRTLRQIFISHSLLFLGCSLEKDKTLELFTLVKNSGEFEVPEHFAILNSPLRKQEKQMKDNFLRDLNIKVIWYPSGQHEYVEKLLNLAADASNNVIKI